MRIALLGAVILIAIPELYGVAWRLQHPAHLGRSAVAVKRNLARALPLGTPLAASITYLAAHGVDVSLDSNSTRRALVGMARNVDSDLFVSESVLIELDFDPEWRLSALETSARLTGP